MSRLFAWDITQRERLLAGWIIELTFRRERPTVWLPSQKTLCRLTGIDERGISLALRSLKAIGVLQVSGTRGGPQCYEWLPNGCLLEPDTIVSSEDLHHTLAEIEALNHTVPPEGGEPGGQRPLLHTHEETLATDQAAASRESCIQQAEDTEETITQMTQRLIQELNAGRPIPQPTSPEAKSRETHHTAQQTGDFPKRKEAPQNTAEPGHSEPQTVHPEAKSACKPQLDFPKRKLDTPPNHPSTFQKGNSTPHLSKKERSSEALPHYTTRTRARAESYESESVQIGESYESGGKSPAVADFANRHTRQDSPTKDPNTAPGRRFRDPERNFIFGMLQEIDHRSELQHETCRRTWLARLRDHPVEARFAIAEVRTLQREGHSVRSPLGLAYAKIRKKITAKNQEQSQHQKT